MGILDHLTCLLRNPYAGQEATVRTGDGTTDWFQIGKGVHQGCILSPCLFNSYADYIMRNSGLEEAQAGIKTAGRNINQPLFIPKAAQSEREKQACSGKKQSCGIFFSAENCAGAGPARSVRGLG